jgi:uncharacterized protein YbjQ (UPF0145 family)
LKKEFEEQKRIKEVLRKMKLKNPSREVWDSYWMGIYNRIERGIAWVVISIGALLFFGYASYEVVNAFINSTKTPPLAKLGITLLVFGALILIFSLIREKIFTSKRDKYKEVQRHLGKDIVAGLKTLVGGEIQEYTKLMAESREQSVDRMIEEAKALGANAIVDTRFATSYIMSNVAEILVYGTAVLIE